MAATRTLSQLESEASDVEQEREELLKQRNEYKKMSQAMNKQIEELSRNCAKLECDLSSTTRSLQNAKEESRLVKEESTKHLTALVDLKEANQVLMQEIQESVDQGQELRARVTELEDVLEEMRMFYQEREVKAGSTCQQQTKLIGKVHVLMNLTMNDDQFRP